ncbi:MAG: hypothetical protein HXX19_16670 [Rhodoferax sp.]|nr:hypothetical protein [Rhodoferax sp.]
MSYWRQFKNFDPVNGQVPYWPFGKLSGVAWRARSLLRNRTKDQIEQIANTASDSIDEYFRQAKDEEIARLEKEQEWEFLEFDVDGNVRGLNSDRENELDFPTSDNTSDLDALSESVGTWSDIFDDGSPDPEDYEYFAAMALWKLADAIYKVTYSYDFKTGVDVKKDRQKLTPSDLSVAGECAIEAMEAVCHAANLRDARRQEDRYQEKIKAAEKHTSAKVQKANDAKWEAIQAQEAKQKSENAKKMAALSKASRNKSMASVLSQWDQDAALQKLSAAKAGNKLSNWLASQDLEFFEPRTVSLWISAHKKAKSAD